MDISDIDAELTAVKAAENGNFEPLAELFLAGKPLGDKANKIIADKLIGKFKAKGGEKADPATKAANKAIYTTFQYMWLSGQYKYKKVIYGVLASQMGRTDAAIKTAIDEGRRATPKWWRQLLNDFPKESRRE